MIAGLHRRARALLLLVTGQVGLCSTHKEQGEDLSKYARPDKLPDTAEVAYADGLKNDWQDWGWAPHEIQPGNPARVRFNDYGGWIIFKSHTDGRYSGLTFKVHPPAAVGTKFLQVRLQSGGEEFPRIRITVGHQKALSEGWYEIYVPFEQLNPGYLPFDRIVFQGAQPMDQEFVALNDVALTVESANPENGEAQKSRVVPAKIDCSAKRLKISPYIYGFAYYPFKDEKEQSAQWQINGTVRRWGGNTTSTYNWKREAWNTGDDWFFENNRASHQTFLDENLSHNVASAVTIPMLGWVSKDVSSSSFPISAYGPQAASDSWRPDAGNGRQKDGKPIEPRSPTIAYEPISPEFVAQWVKSIRAKDDQIRRRQVWMYILDNEPMLWNKTHRDIHPSPTSYDELLQRTIDYGAAIRKQDPDALIAGPAEWGWTGYYYSAKDLKGFGRLGRLLRLDRRAHGDLPVVAYYLKALAEYEKKTGIRILDVLDLHGYPYADGIGSERADPHMAELRIRSTRMLWDSTYTDESWVKEPVMLLPRMREWIDRYYPGRGMSLGEWKFGGESDISGALAIAQSLGNFAKYGLTSAFYWVYPPENSPAMWAFRAYTNFDNHGSRFQNWYVPSVLPPKDENDLALHASVDDSGKQWVLVALNFLRRERVTAPIDLQPCGHITTMQTWTYRGGKAGYVEGQLIENPEAPISLVIPPYSIVVTRLNVE